jgi:WD40 repeat protein
MFNFCSFREAKSSVIKAHGGAIRTVAFSCDGRRLLTGSDDKTIKVLLTYSFSLILNDFLGLLYLNITNSLELQIFPSN